MPLYRISFMAAGLKTYEVLELPYQIKRDNADNLCIINNRHIIGDETLLERLVQERLQITHQVCILEATMLCDETDGLV
ncbi:hypothetical protein [Zooshikella ganghwensis]|uniref:hypothetical protein n=1 Tax=Zooshikella ganghwensis TaxID=202772 RepID=UPI000480B768|nr:hypothetical protein [Zooshikella ganghwensis]